jgi:AraC-like DNA-binding protein
MARHQRTVCRSAEVPGLEQIGRDVRSGTLPLAEHSHEGTEICYLARGEVAWMVGRRKLRLVGGMISVVGPGLAHRGELDVIAPSDLYWTVILPGEIRPRLEPGTLRRLAARRAWTAAAGERIGSLFDDVLAECAARRSGWRAAAGAGLALLAVEAGRLAPGGRGRGSRPLPGPVAEAARILAADLEHPPSVRELAARVGLGPTRFHGLFKRAIGLTPRDYLSRLRLAEARRRLAEGDETVTALAISLGFPSSQHFATTFRKHTGTTPSGFRARARKERQK